MAIDVLLDGVAVPVDEAVFRTLLDNSVAGTYKGYENALNSSRIKFSDLVSLAEKGDIPYSLFFAPFAVVQEQVKKKNEKLLAGLSKDTFSIGSRSKVELRDVELIVKDLIRKQHLVRKYDKSLQRNKIVGVLRDDGATIEADAARLMSAIGLSHEAVRACKTKEKALDLMIDRLEANHVLVSRSVQHYMPQRLTHVKFSGMTIRYNKVPFIFLAGGSWGRPGAGRPDHLHAGADDGAGSPKNIRSNDLGRRQRSDGSRARVRYRWRDADALRPVYGDRTHVAR